MTMSSPALDAVLPTSSEVLVFGPQYLAFSPSSAHALRSQLLSSKRFAWARETLQDLHDHWDSVMSALPLLGVLDGPRLLGRLATWLQTDKLEDLPFPLPNILLTPLVVVSHLLQYQQLGEISDHGPEDYLPGISETLGLCTGHLSAAAVSCSETQSELYHYGAAAIRIAMLVGALVDAKDVSMGVDGRAKSFSVAWDSRNDSRNLEQIVTDIPQVRLHYPFIVHFLHSTC